MNITLQKLFKIYSIGSIIFPAGLCLIYFVVGMMEMPFTGEVIFGQIAAGLMAISFLSIVAATYVGLVLFVKKISFPTFYVILFLFGLIAWTWVVLIQSDGFFYRLLN